MPAPMIATVGRALLPSNAASKVLIPSRAARVPRSSVFPSPPACKRTSVPEDLHRHAADNPSQADAPLFGRVTYEMMEKLWRSVARAGVRPGYGLDGTFRPDDTRCKEARRVEHPGGGGNA